MGFDLQPISSSLALIYPEMGQAEQEVWTLRKCRHQPWSHIRCRTRQMDLGGGSRRKALPGCSCPSAQLVPRRRMGERGPEPSLASKPWAGLSLTLEPDAARQLHSGGSQRWPTASLCHAHSQGKQVLPNGQVCSPPASQRTWSEASGVGFVGNSISQS